MKSLAWMALVGVVCGCAVTPPVDSSEARQPEGQARALVEAGEYRQAMRALSADMAAWAAYTRRWGNTAEGAAGFEYLTVLQTIAREGDAAWGVILDDPDVPYAYKTAMLFEILELRLGKGAVWSPSEVDIMIVPERGRLDGWRQVMDRLNRAVGDQEAKAMPRELEALKRFAEGYKPQGQPKEMVVGLPVPPNAIAETLREHPLTDAFGRHVSLVLVKLARYHLENFGQSYDVRRVGDDGRANPFLDAFKRMVGVDEQWDTDRLDYLGSSAIMNWLWLRNDLASDPAIGREMGRIRAVRDRIERELRALQEGKLRERIENELKEAGQ